ncbi:MAG TPA: DUF488 domain-containing protein [Solirubrobacterales bacterium]|nr:DUF488 domain-containing protein [Solirubrobacterales bacterium]
MDPRPEILTIGHSTHPIEFFLGLLAQHSIEAIADVRRRPASRRNPQFNGRALEASLAEREIAHVAFGTQLGGLRRPRSEGPASSVSGALAAYADHMRTDEFAAGLRRLEKLARERPTAVMCAEADWRRCHRQLIAEALVDSGWAVLHLDANGRVESHPDTLT